jgi:hypothetical protein
MPAQLLLISDRADDYRFFKIMSLQNEIGLQRSVKPDSILKILKANRDLSVVWDSENHFVYKMIEDALKGIDPARIFIYLDSITKVSPKFFEKFSIFGHYLRRTSRISDADFYAKIIFSNLDGKQTSSSTLDKVRTIVLKQSFHKTAAVEALQNVLIDQGIRGRFATSIAQCTDELILNALFDAPMNNTGERYRRLLDRNSKFNLEEKEVIVVTITTNSEYMAVSVKDQFGSLDRQNLLESVFGVSKRKAIPQGKYPEINSSAIGLRRAFQRGISLSFAIQKGVFTQATLYFKLAADYKEVRSSFHFLSAFYVKTNLGKRSG